MNLPLSKNYSFDKPKLGILILTVVFSLVVSYLFSSANLAIAGLILLVTAFLLFTIVSIINLSYFLFTLIIVANFVNLIYRYLFVNHISPPIATVFVVDVLSYFGLLIILIKSVSNRKEFKSPLKNVLAIAFIIMFVNYLIQLFNPNIYQYKGWLIGIITFTTKFIIFWIGLSVFKNYRVIKYFIALWIGLATLGALYGCAQQWIGYTPLDQKFLDMTGNPFYHAAYERKFSIYNDPTLFGLFLGATAVLILILLMRPMNLVKKLILGICLVFILLATAYTGTRTSYVMIPAGVFLFCLMTINQKRTLIFVSVFLISLAGILFGPIYGNATVNRVRSAFIVDKTDRSMEVREISQAIVRDYMQNNPLGGGVGTSGNQGREYNPGHFLNTVHLDSGLMMTAAETGWIGLLIFLSFFFIVLITAVRNFFRLTDPKLVYLNAAIACVIFALVIAMYPQKSSFSYPTGVFVYSSLAILINSKSIERAMKNET